VKGEYLSNPHSISALDRIANAKDRPLTLVGQFPKEEMEEVHLMLRHGILAGQVVQAPPNQVHYLLRVDRINDAGTRLLIEAFPHLKAEIAALPDAQLETEAMRRRGDPRCELARQELARRIQGEPLATAISSGATRGAGPGTEDNGNVKTKTMEANRISQSAHRLSQRANRMASWSAWLSAASVLISLVALWVSWTKSQNTKRSSQESALEQRVRALEQRGNSPSAPFMMLPSQTPSPGVPPTNWTLPSGGTLLNTNPTATPWVIPSRP
jgi:hypothetical protein